MKTVTFPLCSVSAFASESSMLIELLTGTPNRLRVSCRWIMAITRDFRFSWNCSKRFVRADSRKVDAEQLRQDYVCGEHPEGYLGYLPKLATPAKFDCFHCCFRNARIGWST